MKMKQLKTSIDRSALRLRFVLLVLAFASFTLSPAAQAGPDIIVNTTSDVVDFGGAQQVGDLPGPDGVVSLREAVIAANNTPGSQVIGFNIPTSDPGFNGTVFTIKPQSSGAVALYDSGTTIDGTTQTSFSCDTNPFGPEIVLDGSQAGTGSGVEIAQSSCNTIRGLVIHSFPQAGIQFSTGAQAPNNNIVTQCYIGTDETGSIAMLNGWEGVALNGNGNVIQGNLVSGNGISGIGVAGTANVIEGNLVGTDRTGSVALGNSSGSGFGIQLGDQASNNVIGGTIPGARNVVSGLPDNAIVLSDANDNQIIGNFIGTDITGQNPLPNGTSGGGSGVQIVFNCTGNTVEQNLIAYNRAEGVMVGFNAVNNTITRNSIYSNNGQQGIDLGNGGANDYHGDGPTLNDPCDTDTGPNNLQNYPVLYSVSSSDGSTTITGGLNSTPNTTFTIEFFSNDFGNPSGFGDGQTFIGSAQVTTDANCNATFSVVLPVTVSGSQVVTMTATDPNGNTSEFSASGASPVGSNVMVNMGTVGSAVIALTFPQVTSAGTTTVMPVDPSSAGYTLPGTSLAFDITTTAAYPTPVPLPPGIVIGFQVRPPLDASQLTVYHNEGGTLVNVTCPSPAPGPTPDMTTNTIYASVTSLSPFVVAKVPFAAHVQQPVNADGSSVFNANRGVVPMKFNLTQDGNATCTLPVATIAVTRTAGGTVGAIDESVYSGSADTGSNFRSSGCQYVYNLNSGALGAGTYRVDIRIGGIVVGGASFGLK